MNKKTWLLIAVVSAIWICLFPLVVFGEGSGTYIELPAHTCFIRENTSNYANKWVAEEYQAPVRIVFIDNSANTTGTGAYLLCRVSTEYNKWAETTGKTYGTGACTNSFSKSFSSTKTVNDVIYYINVLNVNESLYAHLQEHMNYNPPTVTAIPSVGNSHEQAYYFTFGDGAQEEVTPVNWGLLRDTSYTTRIAGSGQAARQNIDVITWEKSIDTNGNDISECEVEVQAVYGKFTGNTLVDLWETDLQDFAISGSVTLGVLPANSGFYSVSWQKVVEDLNTFDFDLILAHEVNQQIEKNGWYYQIRLLGSDGTIGEWQTLYTPLSMGAKASETIINNNSFDMSVYQVYQDLSTINNNTSITITYIDTDYTINNPNDGTEPEGGTNLWDVLKELISGIFQILAKLGDLVGNLIDGLMGIFQNLFTPSEVDQEINNNINVEVNTYLEESQPGLNEIHNNIDNWKLQIEDIANDYANGGDCIIAWEDVSIDLSAFNAGTVTFIPGGQYDLKTAFISLLTAFGISYSTYEMIVSAIIYISLIVLISHKVKGFLKT